MAEGHARIGASELVVGVPFPAAALEILRHACGSRTEDLVFSGGLLDADEAVAFGVVHEVHPGGDVLLERAMALAAELAARAPLAYRLAKAPAPRARPRAHAQRRRRNRRRRRGRVGRPAHRAAPVRPARRRCRRADDGAVGNAAVTGPMHTTTRRPVLRSLVGAGGGTRTHDLTITNRLRFQLRHTGVHATLPPVLCRPGTKGHADEDPCFARGALAGLTPRWD